MTLGNRRHLQPYTRRDALALTSGAVMVAMPCALRAQMPPVPPAIAPPSLAPPSLAPPPTFTPIRPPSARKFPPDAYMLIVKVIDNNMLSNMMLNLGEAIAGGVVNLTLAFNCIGGNVDSAVALFDVLHAATVNVTTYNMSAVDSAANLIFQAGKRRVAHANSHFLFHPVTNGSVVGGMNLNSAQEMNEAMMASQREMTQILKARTKIPESVLDEMFRRQVILSAASALQYGVVDEITELPFPLGGVNIPT